MAEEYDGHELYSDQTLNALFGVILECVDTAGGDGSGMVVSENYRYYADKFYRYLNLVTMSDRMGEWERSDGDDYVTFQFYQDGVIFAKTRSSVAGWEEIVVELM